MKVFNGFLINCFINFQFFTYIRCCYYYKAKINPATIRTPKRPCEDFYDYACADYIQQHPNPNYKEITQQLDYQLNNKLVLGLRNTFLHHNYDTKVQTYFDKMGIYLESCKRTNQIRNLRQYFDEIRPGLSLNWPLLQCRKEWLGQNNMFDFWPLLGEIQCYGLNNVLVNHQITRNSDNSLNIWLAPAIFEQQQRTLPEDGVIMVLLQGLGIQDLTTVVGHLNNTDLKWSKILEIFAQSDQVQDLTLEESKSLYPLLNLPDYLKKLLGNEVQNLALITLENPQYFEFLNGKIWSKEELEHLCNYLMIKFLFYLAVDSTAEFSALECVKDLRNKFDLAVNYFIYNHFYKRESKHFEAAIFKLENQTKTTMAKYFVFNYLNLSRKQIERLLNKLETIKINIGNLPDKVDYKYLQNFYSSIPHLDRQNYYKNHMLLLKHRFRNSLSYSQNQSFHISADNSIGGISSPFYVAQQNMVVIPFGSLQQPLYHYHQTPFKQLALFGFVLAHEMAHAFDTNGLNYDHRGFPLNSNSDIMSNVNFVKSLDCMQRQKPTEDIDERIADFFALRVVYRAFAEDYGERRVGEKREFFSNLAQFFCGKKQLKFIDHDSDSVRLQLIVKNFKIFSEIFECSKDSPMNSKEKCRIY